MHDDWQFAPDTLGKVTLEDGTTVGGLFSLGPVPLLMRRRVNGSWVYRRANAEEEQRYVANDAW